MEFDSSAFASLNSFGGVDYAPHNKGVTPIFFIESIQDHAASEREGRAVWIDKERVRIHIAGDSTAATHPVDVGIIARFRDQYESWKRRETGGHIKGTPLSKWPMATPSLVRELEALHVFSVEDLCNVSDGNIHNFTNGRAMREMASAWLKSAADGAAVMRYAAENDRLREGLEQAMKRIEALEHKGVADPKKHLSNVASMEFQHGERRTKSIKKSRPKSRKNGYWTPERRAEQGARLQAARQAKAVNEIYETHDDQLGHLDDGPDL